MDGILILDKPKGITSFIAARLVSKAFGREKTGHAGTLDPMATGVLPVMVGRATKLLQYLPETDKEYEAEALFGVRTDTADADGAVLESGRSIPSRDQLEAAVMSFLGESEQIPPMYSAIKKDGVPLYELARKGETVDRQPRRINIYDIGLLSFREGRARLRVRCSAGTYIRTLAEDIAAKCGTVCYLTELRRTSACGFGIGCAVTELRLKEAAAAGTAGQLLISPQEIFRELPRIELDSALERLFMNGVEFACSRTGTTLDDGVRVRVMCGDEFLGLADIAAGGKVRKLWQSRTAN